MIIVDENGGRNSGKNYQSEIALCRIANNRPLTEIIMSRRKGNELQKIKEDTINILNNMEIDFDYKISKGLIILRNNSFIRFEGVYKPNTSQMSFAGLPTGNATLKIFWLDEAFEITEVEWSEIMAAVRIEKGGKLLFLRTSNPKSRANWYIQDMENIQPHIRQIMIDKGQQFIRTKDRIIHYTNFRVNNLMSRADIEKMKWKKENNPIMWEMEGNGMPGNEGKLVYAPFIKQDDFINELPRIIEWKIGVDFGWKKDWTVATLGGFTEGYKNIIAAEDMEPIQHTDADWMNKEEHRNQQAIKIYEWVISMKNKYKVWQKLFIVCDYASEGTPLIMRLNQITIEKQMNDKIEFIPAVKKPIRERVPLLQTLFEAGKIKIVSEHCKYLIQDLQNSQWVENKEGEKRADGDDHYLNAFEYLVASRWKQVWDAASKKEFPEEERPITFSN